MVSLSFVTDRECSLLTKDRALESLFETCPKSTYRGCWKRTVVTRSIHEMKIAATVRWGV